MSVSLPDEIRTLLMTIPPGDVRPYDGNLAFADYSVLRTLNSVRDEHRTALAEIGYDLAQVPVLEALGRAFTSLQGENNGRRELGDDSRINSLRADGRAVRDEIVLACRYHLRRMAGMDIKLAALAEDTGVLDLATDLDTLAAMIEATREHFASNTRFDVSAKATAARDVAAKLRAAAAAEDSATSDGTTRDLRNRAATLIARMLGDLNAALRLATRNEREIAARMFNGRV